MKVRLKHVNTVKPKETYDGNPEANVRLGQLVASKIFATRQYFLDLIEPIEDLVDSLFVGRLCGSESGAIYAICAGD